MSRASAPLVLTVTGLAMLLARPALAQPTYKLGVKPDLKPLATLKLEGPRLKRSDLHDDPGFRMQYHFKKDGKTAAEVEARATPDLAVPLKEAGTYTVVLELFYPAYKGGGARKGEFKAVSNVVTFKWEPGAKPDQPGKAMLIEPPPVTPKK